MNRIHSAFRRIALRRLPYFLLVTLLGFISIWQVSASPSALDDREQQSSIQGGNIFAFLPTMMRANLDEPISAPEILSFTADNTVIEEGESVELSWEIVGFVDSVSINQGVGDVSELSSVVVTPSTTKTYEITATNSGGTSTAELTVTVNVPQDPPEIEMFTATRLTIDPGQNSTLKWTVSNYDSLVINKGIGDVTNLDEFTVSPQATTTYKLTATNGGGISTANVTINVTEGSDEQIVIFDWNGEVTEADRGFPRNQPPLHNYNWRSPVNFAGGTLYVRAEIFEQPVPQEDMKLQFCFWQEKNGDNFGLETCLEQHNVPGTTGTVECWSQKIGDMWKLDNKPLEWERPRFRVAVPIKNGAGKPVSDYSGWDWNGENEEHWYPLDMRFTAIVVAQGGTFSGWGSYGGCN